MSFSTTVDRYVDTQIGPTDMRNMASVEPQPASTDWDAFHAEIQDRISPVAWKTWVAPLQPALSDGSLVLVAPSDFHLRWVRDQHLDAIQEAAEVVFGTDTPVTLQVGESNGDPAAIDLREPDPVATPATSAPDDDALAQPITTKYTFDNFVVGPSNRFAHAAAMAVAEQPGSHYNPLFLYAEAGLGKTHLLHAVGRFRRETEPRSIVRYISSEQFFNEFISGIRRKRMDEFKERYRTTDLLLLDDVQFFEGKEQILEEFFHTFNCLYEAGRQLVISSDRHPRHLNTLQDRLRSRFEWGLLTDIQPPDVETRLAILRKNAEFAPLPVPPDVLSFIAENVLDNIRELEGALTRVTAYAALTHETISLEMAREVLHDLSPSGSNHQVDANEIIERVCMAGGFPRSDLVGPSRRQPLARFRQIAMYLCRDHTDLSLPKIGAAFGGRDHTTVLHAVEKIKTLMQSDAMVYQQVTSLSQDLRRT
jgi:chromosomal replication initiator protein